MRPELATRAGRSIPSMETVAQKRLSRCTKVAGTTGGSHIVRGPRPGHSSQSGDDAARCDLAGGGGAADAPGDARAIPCHIQAGQVCL